MKNYSKNKKFLLFFSAIAALVINLGYINVGFASTDNPKNLSGTFFEIDNKTFSHNMASVNGIQIHYVMGGQGDPVVLLHGYPQTLYEWRHIMPALAENYTVIVPDLRGFGDSSKPVDGYDGKNTAEDIY